MGLHSICIVIVVVLNFGHGAFAFWPFDGDFMSNYMCFNYGCLPWPCCQGKSCNGYGDACSEDTAHIPGYGEFQHLKKLQTPPEEYSFFGKLYQEIKDRTVKKTNVRSRNLEQTSDPPKESESRIDNFTPETIKHDVKHSPEFPQLILAESLDSKEETDPPFSSESRIEDFEPNVDPYVINPMKNAESPEPIQEAEAPAQAEFITEQTTKYITGTETAGIGTETAEIETETTPTESETGESRLEDIVMSEEYQGVDLNGVPPTIQETGQTSPENIRVSTTEPPIPNTSGLKCVNVTKEVEDTPYSGKRIVTELECQEPQTTPLDVIQTIQEETISTAVETETIPIDIEAETEEPSIDMEEETETTPADIEAGTSTTGIKTGTEEGTTLRDRIMFEDDWDSTPPTLQETAQKNLSSSTADITIPNRSSLKCVNVTKEIEEDTPYGVKKNVTVEECQEPQTTTPEVTQTTQEETTSIAIETETIPIDIEEAETLSIDIEAGTTPTDIEAGTSTTGIKAGTEEGTTLMDRIMFEDDLDSTPPTLQETAQKNHSSSTVDTPIPYRSSLKCVNVTKEIEDTPYGGKKNVTVEECQEPQTTTPEVTQTTQEETTSIAIETETIPIDIEEEAETLPIDIEAGTSTTGIQAGTEEGTTLIDRIMFEDYLGSTPPTLQETAQKNLSSSTVDTPIPNRSSLKCVNVTKEIEDTPYGGKKNVTVEECQEPQTTTPEVTHTTQEETTSIAIETETIPIDIEEEAETLPIDIEAGTTTPTDIEAGTSTTGIKGGTEEGTTLMDRIMFEDDLDSTPPTLQETAQTNLSSSTVDTPIPNRSSLKCVNVTKEIEDTPYGGKKNVTVEKCQEPQTTTPEVTQTTQEETTSIAIETETIPIDIEEEAETLPIDIEAGTTPTDIEAGTSTTGIKAGTEEGTTLMDRIMFEDDLGSTPPTLQETAQKNLSSSTVDTPISNRSSLKCVNVTKEIEDTPYGGKKIVTVEECQEPQTTTPEVTHTTQEETTSIAIETETIPIDIEAGTSTTGIKAGTEEGTTLMDRIMFEDDLDSTPPTLQETAQKNLSSSTVDTPIPNRNSLKCVNVTKEIEDTPYGGKKNVTVEKCQEPQTTTPEVTHTTQEETTSIAIETETIPIDIEEEAETLPIDIEAGTSTTEIKAGTEEGTTLMDRIMFEDDLGSTPPTLQETAQKNHSSSTVDTPIPYRSSLKCVNVTKEIEDTPYGGKKNVTVEECQEPQTTTPKVTQTTQKETTSIAIETETIPIDIEAGISTTGIKGGTEEGTTLMDRIMFEDDLDSTPPTLQETAQKNLSSSTVDTPIPNRSSLKCVNVTKEIEDTPYGGKKNVTVEECQEPQTTTPEVTQTTQEETTSIAIETETIPIDIEEEAETLPIDIEAGTITPTDIEAGTSTTGIKAGTEEGTTLMDRIMFEDDLDSTPPTLQETAQKNVSSSTVDTPIPNRSSLKCVNVTKEIEEHTPYGGKKNVTVEECQKPQTTTPEVTQTTQEDIETETSPIEMKTGTTGLERGVSSLVSTIMAEDDWGSDPPTTQVTETGETVQKNITSSSTDTSIPNTSGLKCVNVTKEIEDTPYSGKRIVTEVECIQEPLTTEEINLTTAADEIMETVTYTEETRTKELMNKRRWTMASSAEPMDKLNEPLTTEASNLTANCTNSNATNPSSEASDIANVTSGEMCSYFTTLPSVISCAEKNYRTIDGTCNNPYNPTLGASGTYFRRQSAQHYDDDIRSPRETSQDGRKLPSARKLIEMLNVPDQNRVNNTVNLMFVVWGQFIAYDMISTLKEPDSEMQNCCSGNSEVFSNASCFPIEVSRKDKFYSKHNVTCLNFVRSYAELNNIDGRYDQVNGATTFLDGSAIYGSSAGEADALRTFNHGSLRTSVIGGGGQTLPISYEDQCEGMSTFPVCFMSGDPRVNQHGALAMLHYIFHREHNRIAEQLVIYNLHWDDEKLYQETRKIIGAMIQHITYKEYLPILLGKECIATHNLGLAEPGNFATDYDPNMDPSISNEFSTAAFRFPQSQVTKEWIYPDSKVLKFRNTYNPAPAFKKGEDYFNNLRRQLVFQPNSKIPNYFSDELTEHLFEMYPKKYGQDLASLNIQRGRDHGIGPYPSVRMSYNLSGPANFEQLPKQMDDDIIRRVKKSYSNVEDIDLFVGGFLEKPLTDGLLGETFRAIIAEQFQRTKRGDSFWYELGNRTSSFNMEQLDAIRGVSLARLVCAAGETTVRLAMRVPCEKNPSIGCDSLPILDVMPWREITRPTPYM